jgi:hypothetical protein
LPADWMRVGWEIKVGMQRFSVLGDATFSLLLKPFHYV